MQRNTLTAARKRAKMTGAELARRVGVRASTISRLERGVTVPMHLTAVKIDAALGCRVVYRRGDAHKDG